MSRFPLLHTAIVLAVSLTGLSVMLAATPTHPATAPTPAAAPTTSATTTPAGVTRMKLYPITPGIVAGPDADANPSEPTLDIYLPPADKATTCAVVILPGGGYTNLSMVNEGSSEAKWLIANNIAAFVLRYRHAPRYHYPTPILDAQRAIRVVRSQADQYHLDPNKIGIMGFSAGGHLAAATSTLYDNKLLPDAPYQPDAIDGLSARPSFSILMYPVIDLTDDTVVHKGSRTALTQDNKDLFAPLSPQLHVTKDTPPAFLVQGTNDRTVPVMNSILYYQACLKAGVPVEMHLLENGPHGFGMGLTGANANDEEMKSWPEQALRWMGRH